METKRILLIFFNSPFCQWIRPESITRNWCKLKKWAPSSTKTVPWLPYQNESNEKTSEQSQQLFRHLNNYVTFFLYVIHTHPILLPLHLSPPNFGVIKRQSTFLLRTILIITSHCFQKSVTWIAISVYAKTINFSRPIIKLLSIPQAGRFRWKN